MAELRTAPGMRERSPGVWELIVEAGRDPLTGKRRQVSRIFRGNLRDAKKARAALLVDVGKGRHTGARATLDDLFAEWIVELRRKGRSPNTVPGYELVYEAQHQADARCEAGHQGDHEDADRPVRRPPDARTGGAERLPSARVPVVDVHPGLPMGVARLEPGPVGRPALDPEHRADRADSREVRLLIAEAERGKRPEMATGDPGRRHNRASTSRAVCAAPDA